MLAQGSAAPAASAGLLAPAGPLAAEGLPAPAAAAAARAAGSAAGVRVTPDSPAGRKAIIRSNVISKPVRGSGASPRSRLPVIAVW